MNKLFARIMACFLVISLVIPFSLSAQTNTVYKQEELSQILAPIALYPDDLIAQILMASTYPLEIVEATRWAKANPNLKGSQLATELEKQNWDPSVKSLVNFPQVLNMMNDQLDWTQKLGNAFLAQQKDVMSTIQGLRAKAQAQGNLKTTKEQKVVVQDQVIVIQPADPQVVYVPTYNPTVVYGVWAYPAYPPPYYYPPGYTVGAAAFTFAAGVAVGAAWGYAWGNCNWHGGDVNVNVNRNTSYNNQINRNAYVNQVQKNGQWQHNPDHRRGVGYQDSGTASKFGQQTRPGPDQRKDYRGYTPDRGQQAGTRPGSRGEGTMGGQQRPQAGQQPGTRPGSGGEGMQAMGGQAGQQRGQASQMGAQRGQSGQAFEGMNRSGADTRMSSDRGRASQQSMSGMRSGGAQRSGGMSRGGRR
jgi:hypothetical protein